MTIVVSVVLALGAALLLDWINFPAGALIGAMAVIAGLKLSGTDVVEMPGALRFAALMIIGWDLGTKYNKELLGAMTNNILPLVVVVAAFLVMGWVLAWVLWKLNLMDPVTAILATSPGGLVQMSALTSEMDANTPLVVGFHLLRIVTVLLSVPVIGRLAAD
jgi:membrane AbrB-like protein